MLEKHLRLEGKMDRNKESHLAADLLLHASGFYKHTVKAITLKSPLVARQSIKIQGHRNVSDSFRDV